jgi:multisubunit Na+/H+ antiporter MnhF subunit
MTGGIVEILLLYTVILLVILVAIGIILIRVIRKRNNAERYIGINFHTFYVIGIILIPVGIASMIIYYRLGMPFFIGMPFLTMGITYLIVGLRNKDKWHKDNKSEK